MVALQPVEPLRVAPGSDQVRLCLLGNAEEVLRMAAAQLVYRRRFLKALGGVLADRLQHRESRLFVSALQASEALVGQRGEPVDHVEVVAADALRRLDRAPSREHREPHEQALFRRLEEVVAPVDRRAERALTLGCVSRSSLQQQQTVVEPLQQGRRGQDADASGGKFDRKRQPVERVADVGDRPCVCGGDAEIRPDRARARLEQRNRLARSRRSTSSDPSGVSSGQTG